MTNKKYMIIINVILIIILLLSAFGFHWWTGNILFTWSSNDTYNRIIQTQLGGIFQQFVQTISGASNATFGHIIVIFMYFNVVWFICIEIPMLLFNLVKGVFKW